MDKKSVTVTPLEAANKTDQKSYKVVKNTVDPKIVWVPPEFHESPSVLAHMFRDKPGHLDKNTEENRNYIAAAVSDPRNKVGEKKSGTEIYYKLRDDGYQAWAHVEKGVIRNGGRDSRWARWQAMPDNPKGPGGRTVYTTFDNDLSILKEHVQIDRLTNVYNNTIKSNPWKPHPLESRGVCRDVGGVRHQVGIILDVLEDLQSSLYNDHLFYVPVTEESPLEKEEVLRIVQEIARGVYLHDSIPFYSLNMNPQYQNYSIIHPAYQNTYVGYIISMLDYYLKGFWTGQLFRETFIKDWNNSFTTDEKILQSHAVSINELSKSSNLSSDKYFRNFDQILEDLMKEASFTPEQLPVWKKITENLVISCKILGKQRSIQKHENIFVLDGEIELIHDVEWTPEGKDEEICYEILDHACKILCEQIQLTGFKIPEMQKWLHALKVMNFFAYYFRTLKEAEKIPVFSVNIPEEVKVCPCIFPPIPYPKRFCIEVEAESLMQSLSQGEKEKILEYCKKDSEDDVVFHDMKSVLINKIKSLSIEGVSQLLQEDIESLAAAILISLRGNYCTVDKCIERFLIEMKISSSSYHSQFAWIIRMGITAAKHRTTEAISQHKSKIASKKIYEDEESDILESLKGIEKVLEESGKWVDNPLGVLAEDQIWSYDVERKRLTSVQKDPSGQRIKVFGGYEPSVHNMFSKESSLGRKISEYCRENSIELEYEKVIFFKAEQLDSCPSGLLFTLPIEESLPLSTYGIPYDAIKLFPSIINNTSDQVFYILLQTIREEDEESFSKFQVKDMNCSRLDIFGKGALHYAAVANSPRFLQTFIEQKVDLSFPDSSGWTALHHAAYTGRLDAVELLITDKNLINKKASKGETPVYLAVNNNQILVVEKLIEANADLNIKPSHGYNALMSAIHNNHEDVALLLIQTGKIDTSYTWRCEKAVLHFAIEMQMGKVLEALLRKGMDRNLLYLRKKPIELAQEQKWEKGVEILKTNFAYQEPWCIIS